MTRVSSGTLTVVVFALLAGLAGAYVVRQRLAQPALPPVAQAGPSDVIVPVAAIDLEPGQMLTVNDIALVRLAPENFANSPYVHQAYMRNSEQIESRVLKVALKRGEAFVPTAFYPDGAGPGIAQLLDEGYRAVTIPIEHISAVQGFARPGSFVDVLFRSKAEEDRPEVTITLLERVKVLAVNSNTLSEKSEKLDGGGAVTLAVTPLQAKSLKVVEGRGELSLTLRNPNDDLDFLPVDLKRGENMRGIAGEFNTELEPVKNVHPAEDHRSTPWWMGLERVVQGTDQISLDDLLNIPPKRKPATVTVYRGAAKEVLVFDGEAQRDPEPLPEMIRVPVENPYVRQRTTAPRDVKMPTVHLGTPAFKVGG